MHVSTYTISLHFPSKFSFLNTFVEKFRSLTLKNKILMHLIKLITYSTQYQFKSNSLNLIAGKVKTNKTKLSFKK